MNSTYLKCQSAEISAQAHQLCYIIITWYNNNLKRTLFAFQQAKDLIYSTFLLHSVILSHKLCHKTETQSREQMRGGLWPLFKGWKMSHVSHSILPNTCLFLYVKSFCLSAGFKTEIMIFIKTYTTTLFLINVYLSKLYKCVFFCFWMAPTENAVWVTNIHIYKGLNVAVKHDSKSRGHKLA